MAINLVNDNISTIEIQNKKYNIKSVPFHGTEVEWESNNYIPKDGEIIIYDIDENYNYKRIKIGNGVDNVSSLPFNEDAILDNVAFINESDNENVEVPEESKKLEPLIGTTEEITPSQIAEAVSEGRTVTITHTDPIFGSCIFNFFSIAYTFNAVISSSIVILNNEYIVVELLGSLSNSLWEVETTVVAQKDEIPDAVINPTTAEVGQTIVVKEVDANGKPTKWESKDFPESVKVYTISEIEELTFEEVFYELLDHPIFLYCRTLEYEAYIPLSFRTNSIEGIGFAGYTNAGLKVYIDGAFGLDDTIKVDLREITIPYFQGTAGTGVLKCQQGSWYVTQEQDVSPGIIQVTADQLVDGATISVSYEQYGTALIQAQKTGILMLTTIVGNEQTYLPALFISMPSDMYPATIKIISPSTGSIITLTIYPS